VTSKGKSFTIIGALAAFPRRLAAREVERRGGRLRSNVTRRTTHVVFGRKLLSRWGEAAIATRVIREREAGRELLSENAFLQLLGLRKGSETSAIPHASMIEQSKLSQQDFELLSLFDAFEHDNEPYSFRDLILARKYAGLIAGGATWGSVVRSVHGASEDVTSLTALSLEAEGRQAIYARHGESRSELNGQLILPIGWPDDAALDDLFEQAEQAEADKRFAEAATLFWRCQSIDPNDPDFAFNRANCLAKTGRFEEARQSFLHALKLDAKFVEAWFNLANLLQRQGQAGPARNHLQRAIALDPDYADAVYNLATLEFGEGNLPDARRWWARYLELDSGSEWARNAAKGVQYVDAELGRRMPAR
jgi:tetratricopeptide (TPR) repeat protein